MLISSLCVPDVANAQIQSEQAIRNSCNRNTYLFYEKNQSHLDSIVFSPTNGVVSNQFFMGNYYHVSITWNNQNTDNQLLIYQYWENNMRTDTFSYYRCCPCGNGIRLEGSQRLDDLVDNNVLTLIPGTTGLDTLRGYTLCVQQRLEINRSIYIDSCNFKVSAGGKINIGSDSAHIQRCTFGGCNVLWQGITFGDGHYIFDENIVRESQTATLFIGPSSLRFRKNTLQRNHTGMTFNLASSPSYIATHEIWGNTIRGDTLPVPLFPDTSEIGIYVQQIDTLHVGVPIADGSPNTITRCRFGIIGKGVRSLFVENTNFRWNTLALSVRRSHDTLGIGGTFRTKDNEYQFVGVGIMVFSAWSRIQVEDDTIRNAKFGIILFNESDSRLSNISIRRCRNYRYGRSVTLNGMFDDSTGALTDSLPSIGIFVSGGVSRVLIDSCYVLFNQRNMAPVEPSIGIVVSRIPNLPPALVQIAHCKTDSLTQGIYALGIPGVQIFDNNVNKVVNTPGDSLLIEFQRMGIRIENCPNALIQNNTVRALPGDNEFNAIYIAASDTVSVLCNTTYNAKKHLNFFQVTDTAIVRNNKMRHDAHEGAPPLPVSYGIVLENCFKIGAQGRPYSAPSKGICHSNQWIHSSDSAYFFTARTLTIDTDGSLSPFYYRPNNDRFLPKPKLAIPSNSVAISEIQLNAGQWQAGDSCPAAPAIQPLQKTAATPPEKIEPIQATHTQSSHQATLIWQANRNRAAISSSFRNAYESTSDYQAIVQLSLVADLIQAGSYVEAQQLNNQIIPSNLPEATEQQVNTWCIQHLLGEPLSISARKAAREIAHACPLTHGSAVYAARALLAIYGSISLYPEEHCDKSSPDDTPQKPSIEVTQPLPDVQVYPNPAQNILNVVAKEPSDSLCVSLQNSIGSVVAFQNCHNCNAISLDIHNLNAGIYFIRIETKNVALIKKVVLQK